MNDVERKRAITKEFMDVEYIPALKPEMLPEKEYKKYPIAELASLGIAGKSLISAIQAITGGGESGLYYVYTGGKKMFKSGLDFIGSLKGVDGGVGGGQAKMIPMPANPEMILIAAAISLIEMKLDSIHDLQQDMFDYLKAKEKARVCGDANVLSDILNNYKFNYDNEKYKTSKRVLVQDIRKEAEQSLLLCRNQIERQLSKNDLFHNDKEVNSIIKDFQNEFRDYQQALYLYDFSTFLEIMLLENFDSPYLKSVTKRMEEYSFNYRTLYTKCYDKLEGYSQGSLESLFEKGLSKVSESTGKLIEKIPLVSNGKIDETLVTAGEKLKKGNKKKTQKSMKTLTENSDPSCATFANLIKDVDEIYNQPKEILFDANNLYFVEEKNETANIQLSNGE